MFASLNNMKTKKQQLIEKPLDYASEDHFLSTFFSEKLGLFYLMFNGGLFTYKTWNGFLNKRTYFIEKYNLTEYENN